ncbi:MAG TPA: hypothetical protein VFA70_07120 [Dehalococcoidia bacterium]|nr:hypothetical protein [Dehalococcoidia bacterium]
MRHSVPDPAHEQGVPQAPQWFGSEERFTQTPLQFVKPALQPVSVQVPSWHEPVPFGKLHTLPQPPQLLGSIRVFTHCPLHAVSPLRQLTHATPVGVVSHAHPAGQANPQLPQFLLSVVRSAQVPLQHVWPAGHCWGAPLLR